MNSRGWIERRWRRSILAVGVLALLISMLTPARSALAHPLDVYLQATYITVAPASIVVELDLTPGVLVAAQALAEIDADGDGAITDAESSAYVAGVLGNVTLTVDGQVQPLTVTSIEMPSYLNIQAGYGLIRVFTSATLAEGMTGTHTISFANLYSPTGSMYQVNTFISEAGAITLGTQNRDDTQQTISVDYAVGDVAPIASDASDSPVGTTTATGQAQRLLSYFDTPSLSAWQLMLALGLALVLGGLHALTPGHGKTLVAAYLVGGRGTVKHAAALGAIVTATHTTSVIVIGLIAISASHWIMPSVLVPAMEVFAGMLVVAMGFRLIRQRWIAFRQGRSAIGAVGFTHSHGNGAAHSHLPPAEDVNVGSLVAMGVSGGLVPCPEALGIMIIAVGLNRAVLGLGLIVSFSLGLATMLIAIGIVLVRSRSLVERISRNSVLSGRLSRGLPLGGAIIVTMLGIGVTFGGLTAYLRTRTNASVGPDRWLVLLLLLAAIGIVVMLFERWRERRNSARPLLLANGHNIQTMLPPRYRDGHAVSNAPMPAADLVYEPDGSVAWNDIWGNFCDLALAGGPPHRSTVLQPEPTVSDEDESAYHDAFNEIERGLQMVTNWTTTRAAPDGWIGLICPTEDAAIWLTTAITAENIAIRHEQSMIFLPVGARFRLGYEIKNVVTAVAKTHHY
ncbi:MAG: nickel/cobalt transporter, partial [Thermomicrobiales bacterium]